MFFYIVTEKINTFILLLLGKEYFQAKTDFIVVLTILRKYIVDDILDDIEQVTKSINS